MTLDLNDEVVVPRYEDNLWRALKKLHEDELAEPPAPPVDLDRRRGRRRMLAGAASIAAAAAVVVAAVATTDRSAEPDQDVLVERIVSSTEEGLEESVVHGVGELGLPGGERRTSESWRDETSGIGRLLFLDAQGGPVIDVGPLTGPTVDSPEYSGQRVVDHCVDAYIDHIDTGGASTNMGAGVDDVRDLIAEGDLTEDGTELVDGRALIRLRGTDPEGGDYVLLADPDTYRIVIVRGTIGSTGETFTTTFEYLPRTADNLSQLRPPVPDGFTPGMPPTDHGEHACS